MKCPRCGEDMQSLDSPTLRIRKGMQSFVCRTCEKKLEISFHHTVPQSNGETCAAIAESACGLCGKLRNRGCECFRRGGKCIDDFHPAYSIAHEYITTEKFFGSEKHETALALIQDARLETLSSSECQVVGFDRMRLDKDAQRLKAMADGRLFATRQKMAEKHDSQSDQVRVSTSADVLARYRQRTKTM